MGRFQDCVLCRYKGEIPPKNSGEYQIWPEGVELREYITVDKAEIMPEPKTDDDDPHAGLVKIVVLETKEDKALIVINNRALGTGVKYLIPKDRIIKILTVKRT